MTVSVENLQKWLDAKEQCARKSAMLAQFSFVTMYFLEFLCFLLVRMIACRRNLDTLSGSL
jgi:hypothetical protein